VRVADFNLAVKLARAVGEVDEAIEFARSSPYPEPSAALDHVFA